MGITSALSLTTQAKINQSFWHTKGTNNMNVTEEEIDEIITAVHHQRGAEYITDLLLDLRLRITKD